MKKVILLLSVALCACASPDYAVYADSQAKESAAKYTAEIARHAADAAKYKAMADIAVAGSETAKVAAVMALTMSQNNLQQANVNASTLQAPRPSEALQWASILVPGAVQALSVISNRQVSMNQSDNAASVAISTNGTFLGMAGKIQAPAPNVTTTTNTTTNDNHTQTLSGTGVLGAGTYSTTDNHTQTLSGTGVLGTGPYTTNTPVIITPIVTQPVASTPVVVGP